MEACNHLKVRFLEFHITGGHRDNAYAVRDSVCKARVGKNQRKDGRGVVDVASELFCSVHPGPPCASIIALLLTSSIPLPSGT